MVKRVTNQNRIQEFALKWLKIFKKPYVSIDEIQATTFGEECLNLEFKLDKGHGFSNAYSNQALKDWESLENIITEVTDIPLLGSAIFSQWRYWTYWAYDPNEILLSENIRWFIVALSRLAVLSGVDPKEVCRSVREVQLHTNNTAYGLSSYHPEDEETQRLRITEDGEVTVEAYSYLESDTVPDENQRLWEKSFTIDKALAKNLLETLADFFATEYSEIFATDVGMWKMKIVYAEDEFREYEGSVIDDGTRYFGVNLSNFIRESLDEPGLFVFDGRARIHKIKRITLIYHRLYHELIRGNEFGSAEFKALDVREYLIIDREREVLEYIQEIGGMGKISKVFEIKRVIPDLLNSLETDELFEFIEGNPDDVVEDPFETKDYVIMVEYEDKPNQILTGSFDKKGLPNDFADFIETVERFMNFFDLREIFNPAIYNHVRRRESDYIYCSVEFFHGFKSYYYLTDDDKILPGDIVVVPTGPEDKETIGLVVKVEYFDKAHVPFPLEKVKKIIRKATTYDRKNL